MLKIHHPPARRVHARAHVHFPQVYEPVTARDVARRVAICAAVTAVGIAEIFVMVWALERLLNTF